MLSDRPGLCSSSGWSDTPTLISANHSVTLPLFARQVRILAEEFNLNVPFLAEADIIDRNKADMFTKVFAICQSTWLVVQCIARAVQGLGGSLGRSFSITT